MQTLTSGEIAKYCDVNLRTVIRWLESGKLKGFKLPGRGNNRVLVSDFIHFLSENNMPIPEDLQPEASKLILIVDDELPVARSIQRVARRAGYDTLIATDGFQAGILLGQHKPRIMTLDLCMPDIDGYQVLEHTRQQSLQNKLKIIVISALEDDKLAKAITCGADATLTKPFENQELVTLFDRFMME